MNKNFFDVFVYYYKDQKISVYSIRTNFYNEKTNRVFMDQIYNSYGAKEHYPLRFYTGSIKDIIVIDAVHYILYCNDMDYFSHIIDNKNTIKEDIDNIVKSHATCEKYIVYDFISKQFVVNPETYKVNENCFGYWTNDLISDIDIDSQYILSTTDGLVRMRSTGGLPQFIYCLESLHVIYDEKLIPDKDVVDSFVYCYCQKMFPSIKFDEYLFDNTMLFNFLSPEKINNVNILTKIVNNKYNASNTKTDNNIKINSLDKAIKSANIDVAFDSDGIDIIDLLEGKLANKTFKNKDDLYYVNSVYNLGFDVRCMYYHPASDTLIIYTDCSSDEICDEDINKFVDYKNIEIVRTKGV